MADPETWIDSVVIRIGYDPVENVAMASPVFLQLGDKLARITPTTLPVLDGRNAAP